MRLFDAVFKKQRHVPIEEIMLNYGGKRIMTNAEKYKDEIKEAFKEKGACGIRKFIERNDRCIPSCYDCREGIIDWLMSEYKEPEVDWSKVEVNTRILVSDDGVRWKNRYFAKYEGERIYYFSFGSTSWSCNDCDHDYAVIPCKYAKLAVERRKENNNG